jgi:hypothetical protein
MLERRRRETRCRVEELEVRSAPSIVVVDVVSVPGHTHLLKVSGVVTAPTVVGDRLSITAKYQLPTTLKKVHKAVKDTKVVTGPIPGSTLGSAHFTAQVSSMNQNWTRITHLEIKVASYSHKTGSEKLLENSGPYVFYQIT